MPSSVVIMDRLSQANQKILPAVSNLSCNWELSRAGQITFEVTLPNLIAVGLDVRNLLGQWIGFQHPTLGAWGGQIINVTVRSGIVSISGESWYSLLRGTFTDGTFNSNSPALTLKFQIERFLSSTGISPGTISFTAPDASIFSSDFYSRGQDLADQFIPALLAGRAIYSGYPQFAPALDPAACNIDPVSRVFTLKDQGFAADKSASVVLSEGAELNWSEWADDLGDVVNTYELSARAYYTYYVDKKVKGKKGKKKIVKEPRIGQTDTWRLASNAASQAKFGIRYLNVVDDTNTYLSEDALLTVAQSRADAFAVNEQTLAAESNDRNGIWAAFREGDVVAVNLTLSGRTGKMLIRNRAYDANRETLIIAGEAVLN